MRRVMNVGLGWVAAILLLSGCSTISPSSPQSPPVVSQALPALHGTLHKVQPGETLWRIAKAFGLEPEALAAANQLPNTRQVAAGQELLIPFPQESRRFLWPARGKLLNPVSTALDIGVPEGTQVRAARSGIVVAATPGPRGWGQTVILDHGDGYFTIYAHLNRLSVSPGMMVAQGLPLGSLGTEPLHFEIRQESRSLDTLALLPRTE